MRVTFSSTQKLPNYLSEMGKNVEFPDKKRNYTRYDEARVNQILSNGDKSIPYLNNVLKKSKDEKQICETLYVLDKLCDKYPDKVAHSYGYISKFNNTENPNIQVLLAGIYRKTQVPDGFGPLIKMLVKSTRENNKQSTFDPSEEIGGAILEYLKNYSSKNVYSNLP